jgi:hypothetical protein
LTNQPNEPNTLAFTPSQSALDTFREFKAIVIMANRVAREFNDGDLDTCVLTSYALAAALTDLGYADARPVRVEAGTFPDDPKLYGAVIGRRGLGRARDGYWWGHLVVCIGQSWLLDPTLDQINDANGTRALASSLWRRLSHLNFGISICSIRCGCISLP